MLWSKKVKTVKQIFIVLFVLAGSCNSAPVSSGGDGPLIHYNIGDIGPAGGYIFYAKRNNSNGWRYLEAAPEEAEFQAPWSVNRGIKVNLEFPGFLIFRKSGAPYDVGQGKRNTQLIVEALSKYSGEWETAARLCDELEFNRFDDWYLPNTFEMRSMYINLKSKNLGGFGDNIYWTSYLIGEDQVYSVNFRDGSSDFSRPSTDRYYVRPIRQVPGP